MSVKRLLGFAGAAYHRLCFSSLALTPRRDLRHSSSQLLDDSLFNVPTPIPQIAPGREIESPPLELILPKAAPQGERRLVANRQLMMAVTLAAYCGVIFVGVSHHEPWADEAHAWLLSRDLGYRYLVFRQLAYEGHPPLWGTLLWIANHWLHLPYQALGWIGGLCAISGCWFFCRYSPFPLFVRLLFPFTYFMAFQYAIVARPYVLLPLFTFAAAHFFEEAGWRPWKFVAASSALVMLCASGVMIAVGLVAARIWYSFRAWADIPSVTRRTLIGSLVVFSIILALIAYVNWPPPDRITARHLANLRLPVRSADETTFGLAFLPRDISAAFVGSFVPSLAFLLVIAAWCAYRRRFLSFVLPMALVLAFFVKVYGNLWHSGALAMIAVAAVWIAFPLPAKCSNRMASTLNALMLLGVVGFLAINLNWTARTVWMDYFGAYSGSADAASFLHSVGANHNSTCGFGFHSSAVQPYFQESIFKNWPQGESFWRFEQGNHTDEECYGAEWVVGSICCTFEIGKQSFWANDRMLRMHGYFPAHVSRGAMFFEGHEVEPTDFVVYRAASAESFGGKLVFVRQLRGPHLSTCP